MRVINQNQDVDDGDEGGYSIWPSRTQGMAALAALAVSSFYNFYWKHL